MFREMRRKKQEITKEECINVLVKEKRGALAVIGDDGYPYTIPLNFYFDEKSEKIYFHAAKEGHKIDAIKNNDEVCFAVWNTGELKCGDWAYYVTSVVVFGKAKLVSDDAVIHEKVRALGMKYYPKAEEVDEEIARDLSRVQIVEISIEHMSGKYVHEK